MKTTTPSSRLGISRLVERQMRNWELARAQRDREPALTRPAVADYLTVSRMAGMDLEPVVNLLGEHLKWPVFDREILNAMAGDDKLRRQIYDSLDQRDLAWWDEALRSFVYGDFGRNDYFRRLCETLLSLARQGSCIFVGRGADLVLPPERGFRIRLTSARQNRVAQFAQRHNLDSKRAEAKLDELEARRANFFKRHFHVAEDEATRHDLVLNLDRYGAEQAVGLILAARRARQEP